MPRPLSCKVFFRGAANFFKFFAIICNDFTLHNNNKQYQSNLEQPRRHPSRQKITTQQSPNGYNGMSHIFPKTAPSLHLHPISYAHLSTDPTHHSKRYPDPICRFSTVHLLDRQTDRWARREVCTNTRLRSIDYRVGQKTAHYTLVHIFGKY